MLQSKPGIDSGAPNTPSPSSRATAAPFGPAAAMMNGTSIGRGGAKPVGWSIWIMAPSQSTSSPASKALTTLTY